MQQPPDGLPADRYPLALVEQQRQHGAGPPASEEAEVTGGLGGHPGDEDGDPTDAQPKGVAPRPPGQSVDPLGLEPLLLALAGEGAAATGEDLLDVGPRAALGQQEDDVDVEAACGVGILAVDRQQFITLAGGQGDHRRVPVVRSG